jgi:hypothetical protein
MHGKKAFMYDSIEDFDKRMERVSTVRNEKQ